MITDSSLGVNLNVRDRGALNALREQDGKQVLDLSALIANRRSSAAYFFVVDGQHRVLALEKLISEDPDRWKPFTLPFVCMLGADEDEEMDQFYVVNSKAKSVIEQRLKVLDAYWQGIRLVM